MNEASPDRDGKVFIVTGANSGLGLETARNLARGSSDNTVMLACRDLNRAEEARRDIARSTGNTSVRAMRLDLSSLASVRQFVAQYRAFEYRPIDALVCNAGISRGPVQTPDGIDSVFETNHLSHFLLTVSLLERMSATGRIISVTSDMHQPPGRRLAWPGAEALAHPTPIVARGGLRYSYSKLCNLYFIYELSRRLQAEDSGITATAFNPGLMTETNFATMPGAISGVLKRVFASRVGSLGTSAAALAQLAAGPEATGAATAAEPIDGRYFDRSASVSRRSSELSYDIPNARELWELSARLTQIDM